MKKQVVILLSVLASVFAFTGCDSKAASTPEFDVASKIIRTTVDGVCDTISIMDTLHVGDTVRWNVMVSGGLYYNSLVSFSVLTDTASLPVSIIGDSILEQYITTGTDLAHARIVFKPETLNRWFLWLQYVPRSAGSHKMQFVVANDAGQDYSPRSWFWYPIVK